MATEWDSGQMADRRADLARARVVSGGVQLEFAARVQADSASVRAKPVLTVEMSPQAARSLLRLLNALIADWESSGR